MIDMTDMIRQFQANAFGQVEGGNATPSRLKALHVTGANPGSLLAKCFVPGGRDPVALVVILHGCTQTADAYDHGSGWTDLAERFGFAVLMPEQQRGNNPNLCFNWFRAEDTTRGVGEALSIRTMIAALCEQHPIDENRIFVTGLSAGGAMTAVMLATYPEVFAGGSVIAGLPYGSASTVAHAMQRMRGAGHADNRVYADLARRASSHRGRFPTVAIWHGDADHTVNVSNADALVAQWLGVHGLDGAPDEVDAVDGQRHRIWWDSGGRIAVEDYRISGVGHGTPLKTRGVGACGVTGPYMLEAGISSTWRQAERWGLVRRATAEAAASAITERPFREPEAKPASVRTDVAATIDHALRAAGLMR